jgi:hypothetical protein
MPVIRSSTRRTQLTASRALVLINPNLLKNQTLKSLSHPKLTKKSNLLQWHKSQSLNLLKVANHSQPQNLKPKNKKKNKQFNPKSRKNQRSKHKTLPKTRSKSIRQMLK